MDRTKRPRVWATIWEGVLTSGKPGTRARHLANVERFYQSAERTLGFDGLDDLITSRDFDKIEICLTSYLSTLQNQAVRCGNDLSDPWRSSLKFLREILSHLSHADGATLSKMQSRVDRLGALYSQIRPRKKKEALPIRALPADVVEDLCDIFDPHSSRNPFGSFANKVRNYLIFVLCLGLGLRRGEILILPANAFKSEIDLKSGDLACWLNVSGNDREDSRYCKPSLKTSYSERQIPVTPDVLNLVDYYKNGFRARSTFGQLFISQKGAPLSAQSMSDIFVTATLSLTDPSKRALEARGWMQIASTQPDRDDRGRKRWLSPHDLRHTAAVIRLKRYVDAGSDMETALRKLRVYFGWSFTSKMPFHYARAYWLTDAAEKQELRFDRFITALGHIDGLLTGRSYDKAS